MAEFVHAKWRKLTNLMLNMPFIFLVGVLTVLLLFGAFFGSNHIFLDSCKCNQSKSAFNLHFDPPVTTFYDYPSFGYTIDKPIKNWDQKRKTRLNLHPSFEQNSHDRVFIVTRSRSTPCKDHEESLEKNIFIEKGYYLEGYWVTIVDTLKNVSEKYLEIETTDRLLRRRHAEIVSVRYGMLRQALLKDAGNEVGTWRRPFVTHFAGCQPCNGKRNPLFTGKDCMDAMNKALNFADYQILWNYGFVHRNLSDSSVVSPLPFDCPA
uniref:Galactosyl transferase n=1 Tax=Tanacetum cinerariifolium TaxID=118510 RepID=A0A6L2JVY7_TANCI|nr:galactosyl transferase [Tanacetum cinerariifolium]